MAKISIITPAYNASAFLSETIESVLKQTYKDWEMIIIDDCSTDNTFNIAKTYASLDNRIKVIKNEENLKVAATRNKGLDVATGDYIAFIDSDDIWLPEKIEKQFHFMERNKYALTYTMYQKYITETKKMSKIVKAPKKMTHKAIYGNTSIGCLTVMVNRKMVGDFHMPLLNHTEDNCTWQEILSRGYTAFGIQEVLALYRVSSNSLTSSKLKSAKQQWKVYREYYKFSITKSIFYFTMYAINAIRKHI